MPCAIIKLAYRQVIDCQSSSIFARNVYQDSYREFLLQSQAYNPDGKHRTMSELVSANPKANSLHYKVGFSIGLYVNSLNGVIPDLRDTMGDDNVPFVLHRFTILESDIRDKTRHRIAITYETGELTLEKIIGERLLLRIPEGTHQRTFLLRVQENLAIIRYKELHGQTLTDEVQDSSRRQPDVDRAVLA